MDIDIDFPDRTKILSLIEHIPAVIVDKSGNVKKHISGVYCTPVPINPLTGESSIDYKEAEARGYFKIDFLNASLYKDVVDEEHLTRLLNQEPVWDLLEQAEFSDMLFHLNGYHDVLMTMKPKTVEQLAAVLAMIRPAKRYLIGQDWNTVFNEVWTKPVDGSYYFKKSHSISYALAITVQMNLICEQLEKETDELSV